MCSSCKEDEWLILHKGVSPVNIMPINVVTVMLGYHRDTWDGGTTPRIEDCGEVIGREALTSFRSRPASDTAQRTAGTHRATAPHRSNYQTRGSVLPRSYRNFFPFMFGQCLPGTELNRLYFGRLYLPIPHSLAVSRITKSSILAFHRTTTDTQKLRRR